MYTFKLIDRRQKIAYQDVKMQNMFHQDTSRHRDPDNQAEVQKLHPKGQVPWA